MSRTDAQNGVDIIFNLKTKIAIKLVQLVGQGKFVPVYGR